jgi:hypothetical protein
MSLIVLLRIALMPIDFLFLGGARDYRRSIVRKAAHIRRSMAA